MTSLVRRGMSCPPERVLDLLADGWAYTAWVVGTCRIRGVDDTWPAPGSRVAHSAGVWPLVVNDETEVLDWDRVAGRLRLRARGWPVGEAEVVLAVKPHSRGCVVSIVEDATRGPGRLVPGPIRRALIGARNRECLRRLAALAEHRPMDRPLPER